MKFIFTALFCAIVAISKAKYLPENGSGDNKFEDELEELLDQQPSPDKREMTRLVVIQEGLKILVNCIHAKNVSEERCFKDFSDHLKPYPETKPCFEALENCHFSPKSENVICLTDFENCLNKPVD